VPDDLLRFVGAPSPYSASWLWIALVLLLVVIAWHTTVFVWTLPAQRLRSMPVIRDIHANLLRRRFARTIRSIDERYRNGNLSAAQAGTQMSRTLRSFLHLATGTRAQYMHVDDVKSSDLADAAPLLLSLNDLQFNTDSQVGVSSVSAEAEELIRTWS
jgi:hypothetical protein